MKPMMLMMVIFLAVGSARAEILVQEDFEDSLQGLRNRGFFDIKYESGEHTLLSVVGEDEVKPMTGQASLKISYPLNSAGGWMHHLLTEVPEFYVRYYRYFPEDWEWPLGFGPHDTITFAGAYTVPTDTDLSVYLDFWKTGETFVRVATAKQKWGYGGYAAYLLEKGGVWNRLPYNVGDPDLVQLGKWHSVEYYAKMNDPDQENGRFMYWVNGELISDLGGMMLRDEDHDDILFNRWMLGPYFHGGSPKAQHNYMDALVISTEYIGPIPPGDANNDGKVDGADLAMWQRNYDPLGLNENSFPMGDWNWDGRIDGDDLALWQRNYDPVGPVPSPLPSGAGGIEVIPEPATMFLLGTGVLVMIGCLRRRRLP